jgi:hypothetical protein
VSIPYQDTTLPGYLFLVDDSGVPRPTIIYTSGYDSTSQEGYFVLAVAAMLRGYNVLAFDGPRPGRRPAPAEVGDAAGLGSGADPGRRLRTDPPRDRTQQDRRVSATAWAAICLPGPPHSSTGRLR